MKKYFIFILFSIIIVLFGCSKPAKPIKYEYTVEDIKVTTNDFSLSGKITIPETKKPVPAVIIIHGSGPSDMDGTVGSLKPYKDLSEQLGEKGIASIRYNKKAFEFSDQVIKDYEATIEDEYIIDCLQAFNILLNDNRIDENNIFIIGHSLGAQISPLIINREPKIKGGILLAGTTAHLLDVVFEQLEKQDTEDIETYRAAVLLTKALTKVNKGEEHYNYFGAYGEYWVNYNKIDWEAQLLNATNNHPLLIMQGGLDLQVYAHHYERYKTLLTDNSLASFKHYPDLNHCFVDGTGETITTAYKSIKDIPTEVIDDIVSWIDSQK